MPSAVARFMDVYRDFGVRGTMTLPGTEPRRIMSITSRTEDHFDVFILVQYEDGSGQVLEKVFRGEKRGVIQDDTSFVVDGVVFQNN